MLGFPSKFQLKPNKVSSLLSYNTA